MTLTYLILFALFMFLIIFTHHYLHKFYNLPARFSHIFTLGCFFFFFFFFLGKSKYGFVISDQWILQRQKNAKSEKRIIFHVKEKQTNPDWRAVSQTKQTKLTGLFWRKSSMKMPPEKKNTLNDR